MKQMREQTIGGSINPDYDDNWSSLFISIIKNKSADDSLSAMRISPYSINKIL